MATYYGFNSPQQQYGPQYSNAQVVGLANQALGPNPYGQQPMGQSQFGYNPTQSIPSVSAYSAGGEAQPQGGMRGMDWAALAAQGVGAIGSLYGAYKQGQGQDRQLAMSEEQFAMQKEDRERERERRSAGTQMFAQWLAAQRQGRGG